MVAVSGQSTESGDSAFDALMARRNGEPLPEPTCPHLARDHDGKCWACVYDERERALKAEVLREAADAVLREFDPPIEACIWASEWLRDRAERVATPPGQGGA